jgi:hypothetical protein
LIRGGYGTAEEAAEKVFPALRVRTAAPEGAIKTKRLPQR